MNRIVHFELPADNPDRAVEFYKKSFGWQIQKWPGPQDYWLVTTGADGEPGINGGILRRQHPGAGTCNGERRVSRRCCGDHHEKRRQSGARKDGRSRRGLSCLLHGHGRQCVWSAATRRERKIDWLLGNLDSIRVNEVPRRSGQYESSRA
jgi:catechol 2,3-dioxygenase-like lactoylglutathione lyase family enzyme